MRQRLLTVTLLLLLFSNRCIAQYELTGTLYPLRWGQQEGSADLVLPANRLGHPLCVKMGSTFGCRFAPTGGSNVLGWKVSSARLVSRTSGQVYWTVNDPGVGNLISPSATYSLPNIPSLVDHARLEMSFVIYYWGPWGPVYYITPPYSSEEVFIVLDEPKAPMNPAWVSVLRRSCVWAREANTASTAAERLTKELYLNRGYNGVGTFVKNVTDSGETFRLKSFIDRWSDYVQCNDFADFLVCLVNSLGAYEMRAQRTYSLGEACLNPGGTEGGWRIWTNIVDPAGPLIGSAQMHISYHQFACVDHLVWDAAYAFILSNIPTYCIGWDRHVQYRMNLVYRFLYYEPNNAQPVRMIPPDGDGAPWNPTPSGGFIPNVAAQ